MCTLSVVLDHYREYLPREHPGMVQPVTWPSPGISNPAVLSPPIGRDEFDALHREVRELTELVKKAIAIDKATNQPDCEDAEKLALVAKFADVVGVDLYKLLGRERPAA